MGHANSRVRILSALLLVTAALVGGAQAGSVSVLWWDSTPVYSGQAPDALRQEMSDYLTNFGGGGVFSSTYVSSEVLGTLASHLAVNSYDVLVFDATSTGTKFNAADLSAIRAHYDGHQNLLFDGTLYIRSINYNATTDFPGPNGATGGLTVNEVYQLGIRGGGIMVGTDHEGFQVDADQVVSAILPGAAFTGVTLPSTDGVFHGAQLLNSAAAIAPLDVFTHWDSVPTEGIAPTSIAPGDYADYVGNLVTLYSQVECADDPGGGTRYTYISTSWAPGDAEIPIDDPEPPPPDDVIPEPVTVLGILLGLGGLGQYIRRRLI